MVEGTQLNRAKLKDNIDRSVMMVTALSPVIGYDRASPATPSTTPHPEAGGAAKGVGEDLFDRMRREPKLAPIPTIAFSADSRPEAVQAALAHGFKEYWTKPMAVAALLEALDRIACSYGAGADRSS